MITEAPTTSESAVPATAEPMSWISRIRWTFARKEFLSLVDQGVVSATNFLTNVIVAKYCLPMMTAEGLSREDAMVRTFGIFYLAITLMHFIKGIQEQIVSAPYTIYSQRRDEHELSGYAGSSLVHQCFFGLMAVVVLCVFSWALDATAQSSNLVAAARILMMVVPFFLLREFIRKLLFAHFQFGAALTLDIVVAVVQLGCILALALTGRLTVYWTFGFFTLASLAALAVWYVQFRREFSWSKPEIFSHWWENWTFGKWALTTHIVGCSIPYFMPWFIQFVSNEHTTGRFGACQALVGLANVILMGVSNFLSPKSALAFNLGGKQGLMRVLKQALMFFAITMGLICLGLAGAGDWLPKFVMGQQYEGLGITLLLLALALFAGAIGMTAGNGIWAINRPALNLSADLTCLLVTFGIAPFSIAKWGAAGAAGAVLVGATAAAVLRWYIFLTALRQIPSSENAR